MVVSKDELDAERNDSGVYSFGDWTLNYLSNQLIQGDAVQSIEHRHAALLRLLITSNNKVLSRDEILAVVWQGKVVNDESIAVAISQIRKLLDDDARAPRFIKTIPSVGYQFIATVVVQPLPTQSGPTTQPTSRRNFYFAAATAAGLILTAMFLWIHHQHEVSANLIKQNNEQLSAAKALLLGGEPSRLREAVVAFRQILAKDPNNAKAWLGLAEAKMWLLGDKQTEDANYQELTTLLRKALTIDPSLARAHLWLARLLVWHDQNFKAAQQHFETALQLDSKDEDIQLHYTHFLMIQKRFDDARTQIGNVRNLDPLQFSHTQMVWAHMIEGNYQAAATELDRIAATEEEDEEFHRAALNVYSRLGKEQLAFTHMQWFFQNANLSQNKIVALNKQFERLGLKGVYQSLLDSKETADVGQFTPPLSWARYAVAANRRDSAINFLKMSFDAHHPHTQCVGADPMYQPLYDDQRFRQLISRGTSP